MIELEAVILNLGAEKEIEGDEAKPLSRLNIRGINWRSYEAVEISGCFLGKLQGEVSARSAVSI